MTYQHPCTLIIFIYILQYFLYLSDLHQFSYCNSHLYFILFYINIYLKFINYNTFVWLIIPL